MIPPTVTCLLNKIGFFIQCVSLAATMILLDKVATKVHLTYDDGGENHKERVLVYIGVSAVGSQDLYFSNIICYEKNKYDLTSTFAV